MIMNFSNPYFHIGFWNICKLAFICGIAELLYEKVLSYSENETGFQLISNRIELCLVSTVYCTVLVSTVY